MTSIQLLDINTGIIHTLQVSEEDAQKANEGKIYNITYMSIIEKLREDL